MRAARPLRPTPIAPFRLTHVGGEIGVRFDYLRELQTQDRGEGVELLNRTLEEYIRFRLQGYAYHPRFLEIRSRLKFAKVQQRLARTGGSLSESEKTDSFLDDYDFHLDFLKEHPFSLSLFASRDKNVARHTFSNRILLEREEFGGRATWKKEPFPMNLSVRQTKRWEASADSHTESVSNVIEYIVRNNFADRMRSEFRYRSRDFEQLFESTGPRVETMRRSELKSNDFSFFNSLGLNKQQTSYLNTFLRFYKQTGDQELQTWNWQERLSLRHSPSLSTYYQYNYIRNEQILSVVETQRAEAGLNHRLYESLDTHLDLHWRKSVFSDTTDVEQGVTGRIQYRKRTPWGTLGAGYGRTVDWVERTGGAGTRSITDEALTLSDAITVYLSEPGVIAGSIEVTDINGIFIYTEGLDYDLEIRGNETGLRLVPGGVLNDGETVLVDYDVTFTSNIAYISDSQSFNARYDFERYLKGMSVYYRWHDLDARGEIGADDSSILISNGWLTGFRYRWRWLTWTEEYEEYASNFTRYTQVRSQLEGRHRLSSAVKWGWHAGLLNTNYGEGSRGTAADFNKVFFAGAVLNGSIRNRGFWELEARARKESGLIEETLIGAQGKMGMRFRKVRLDAGFEAEERQRFDSGRDRTHVFLQIAREF